MASRLRVPLRRWGISLFGATVIIAILAIGVGPRLGGANANDRCASIAEGTIVESQKFVIFEDRLGGLVNEAVIVPVGSVAVVAVPPQAVVKVASLGGLARQHTIVADNGVAYAYFLDGPLAGLTRNEFVRRGGIQLDQDPRVTEKAFAAHLLEAFGERVVAVAVGAYDGAVTWSDPDVNGMRPHNVYWSDGAYEYALTANLSAAAVVNLARSLVC
jgi:hypothetical protein